ncbi:hypothetical protein C0995_010923 [Termitomyces sp. Mi166|nr:hypothetical protein C0995_010923 [Termitomyces sp. Mi166\
MFMLGLMAMQSQYTSYKPSNSEEFSSASKSIKLGLITSGIVLAWTTAATLLQSSAVAYKYGISGPWWYGAGAMIQVLLFAQLVAKLKLNALNAHTWLEIAMFLIPLGIAIYVIFRGMHATLLCDYTHTTLLLCIVLTFIFTVYFTSPKIRSISVMHELLSTANKPQKILIAK